MSRTLLDALLEFGRAARAEGLSVSTGQVEELARALRWTGIEDRGTVFLAARSLLVTRKEDREPFRNLFDRFWRPPGEEVEEEGLLTVPPAPRHRRPEGFTVASYMASKARADAEELDLADRAGTFAPDEVLRRKRFAEMTPEELDAVRRLIRELHWDASFRITRRRKPDARGRQLDLRRILARTARTGSLPPRLPRRRRRLKPRPVVLLADVSGSMEKYSRLVLQFFHALVATTPRAETFVFGTRLTRITPQLAVRDVDAALEEVSREVSDWAGGTRIGACLGSFNRDWSRRVLRRGAVAVVVSDGCDAGDVDVLAREMRHLQHRSHRLVWLNPYLGNERYEPRVAGMRSVLPFVDDFLPADDVQSLEAFSRLLARLPARGRSPRPGRLSHADRPRRDAPRQGKGQA